MLESLATSDQNRVISPTFYRALAIRALEYVSAYAVEAHSRLCAE
jgi:hypothetical protein